jgi:putative transport protein
MESWKVTGIIHSAAEICRSNPAILLFAALAGGYAFGKLKFGSFSFGSTTGVLLVAIVTGAVLLKDTTFDLGIIKTVSFGLFIFTIGYRVGPDFAGGLKRGGAKYIAVAVFFSIIAIGVALAVAQLFHLNGSYGAGIVAGALTQSAVIGTADGAIMLLESGAQTVALNLKSDVAVAYAVTYIFGTAGLIMLLKVLPAIWKIDLKKSALQEEKEMGSTSEEDTVESFHWSHLITPRAFTLTVESSEGKTRKEVESLFSGNVAIETLVRNGKTTDPVPADEVLESGDTVVLTGRRKDLLEATDIIGAEVNHAVLKEMLGEVLSVCVTAKKYNGKKLSDIFAETGHGCFVHRILRQAHDLPLNRGLRIHTGDTIMVMGNRPEVERFVDNVGYPERATAVTDLIAVGIGLVAGTLTGLLSVAVGGVSVTLGAGGGVLVSGLFFGWLRSKKPVWGQIPVPAQWIFTDLGLNFFIACVGLAAGPRALAALKQAGPEILIAGIILTVVPHLLTWIFGLYGLKLNPVLLLGAMTGAGTCTAALNSVKEDCGSSLPVIGYTVPYAVGNVLLTVMGALVVNIM